MTAEVGAVAAAVGALWYSARPSRLARRPLRGRESMLVSEIQQRLIELGEKLAQLRGYL